jgi:hypothetical protein
MESCIVLCSGPTSSSPSGVTFTRRRLTVTYSRPSTVVPSWVICFHLN